jgi:hypothetical protein
MDHIAVIEQSQDGLKHQPFSPILLTKDLWATKQRPVLPSSPSKWLREVGKRMRGNGEGTLERHHVQSSEDLVLTVLEYVQEDIQEDECSEFS